MGTGRGRKGKSRAFGCTYGSGWDLDLDVDGSLDLGGKIQI